MTCRKRKRQRIVCYRAKGLVGADDLIAVITAPPLVLPTGTAGGFLLFGGAGGGGAVRLCLTGEVVGTPEPFACEAAPLSLLLPSSAVSCCDAIGDAGKLVVPEPEEGAFNKSDEGRGVR